MTRGNKIRLLKDLKDGKIKIDLFQPPKVYVFIKNDDIGDYHNLNGVKFSEIEFRQIKDKVEIRNTLIDYYNMGELIGKSDVIELVFKEGATIL